MIRPAIGKWASNSPKIEDNGVEWRDEGIVIGVRRHGETSVILDLLTRQHGRHLGLVRGGRSHKLQPSLQVGNGLDAVWRARIEDHLGDYKIEARVMRAARLMDHPAALYGLSHLTGLARLLPERDPHEALYETLGIVLDQLVDPLLAAPLVIRFELAVLGELGFGLDLGECAATGRTDELVYVSPKSGRAVSREAGLPWHDKLLSLPEFLKQTGGEAKAMPDDLAIHQGFLLTGFFLERHVYGPRALAMPDARQGFIASIIKSRLPAAIPAISEDDHTAVP
jgi:DNA repair protein RecO (recombination protein O)